MRTLLLVEGESDCWTCWFAGYHALGFPGASTYRKLELWHVENFGRVIIIQEPDAAGATFAAGVSARLAELGFKGEALIAAMEGSGFKDPSDLHCDDPARFKERFEAVLAGARPFQPPKIPTIYPKGLNLDAIVVQTLDALMAANNPPHWFTHDATHDPIRISVNGRPEMVAINVDSLRLIVSQVAKWAKLTEHGPEPILPPREIVACVHTELRQVLPPLRGLTHVRMYKAGGGFMEPGYDAPTRLWCAAAPNPDTPEMGFNDAFTLIEEMLCDFHFTSPADKAHAVSLFLLPFMREVIVGSVPIYAIESPRAGTGKGLLARSLLSPSHSFYIAPDVRAEEKEKYLTSAVLGGWPAFVVDNVHDAVTSAMLASLATNPNPNIRPFGRSDTVRVARLPIFVITANNPTFSEENARRVARIRIDSNAEDPSLLPTSAFKNRQEIWMSEKTTLLQAAARAVIQHWFDLGRPRLETDVGWGSFEEWFEIMGGITESCGWLGLGATRINEMSIDERERRWIDLLELWAKLQRNKPIRVRDLVALADQIDDFWGEREVKSKSRVLGRILAQRRDQVFGEWKIVFNGRPDNIPEWRLKPIEGPDLFEAIKK